MAASDLPKQIGRYRIRSRIATAQTSVLFRAYDPVRGGAVAVQLFGRPFVTERFLTTLQRDASKLSQLTNEHLLKVHTAGVEKGHAFLVTEVPPPYTLAEIIADGPISPVEADELITVVANGLTAMHEAGLLHRQLAPASIYIDGSGDPVIGGYCPLNPREAPLAAPEQRQGQPLTVRGDIYSLGLLLLFVLTGRTDLSVENLSQLPTSYQDIVRQATAAASLARYNSAAEMAAALPIASRVDTPQTLELADDIFAPAAEAVAALEPEPVAESAPPPIFPEPPELAAARQPEARPGGRGRIWPPFLLGLLLLCAALTALGWWYSDAELANIEPTAAAPTMIPTAVANATATPTRMPTPTPVPVDVSIHSPAEGTSIDLGQAIQLNFGLSDPVGLRTINVLANGLLITSFNAGGATEYVVDEMWTPNWRGGKVIEVVAINRNGEPLPVAATTIRVIDRALLAQHDATWNRIEANVRQIRGLEPLAPIFPDMISRSELQRRVLQDDYFYDEATAHKDVIALHAFDFVPLSFDLYTESRRYLGSSILGFYNALTKEFVIVSDDDEMDVFDEWTYAHEFMHALQDQHFDLTRINSAPLGFEQQLAFRSLAEGEAEFIQRLYLDLGYFSQAQLVEIYSDLYFDVFDIKAQAPSHLPDVLVNAVWFPYTLGEAFVATLYQRNGWAGVDAAWADVPQSSEQIIHPDRYLAVDRPVTVTLPELHDTLGTGYVRTHHEVFGEFYLREFLSQQLSPAQVDVAATGWGGDRFAIYWHEEAQKLALLLHTVWDSSADADEFAAAYRAYASAAYGSVGEAAGPDLWCWQTTFTACLLTIGDDIIIIRAPQPETAREIAGIILAAD